MRIQDLEKNQVIHCATEKEAIRISDLAEKLGFKLTNGKTFKENWWENCCFNVKEGTFGNLNFYKKEDYTIITSLKIDEYLRVGDKIIYKNKLTLIDWGKIRGVRVSWYLNKPLTIKKINLNTFDVEESHFDFPKKGYEIINSNITEKDLIGDLKDFPIKVVEKMLERQVEQGNKKDVTVFQKEKKSHNGLKGFHWDVTKEGVSFWHAIITRKNFDLFFKKYPKNMEKLLISREDIANLWYKDSCKEWKNIIVNVLKSSIFSNKIDVTPFLHNLKDCSNRQLKLLSDIGITSKNNILKELVEGNYWYCGNGYIEGFIPRQGVGNQMKKSTTYETKEQCQKACDILNLHQEMMYVVNKWNTEDNFVPDWESIHQDKWGMMMHGSRIEIGCYYKSNILYNQLAVSSEKRAKDLLELFKDRL